MGVQQRRNQKGFTLIEIVLVLAIAGLIFVIVFLAVQGAQRARRDLERKSAAARAIAAAEQLASNNSGRYRTTSGTLFNCNNLTTPVANPAWNGGGYGCTNYAGGGAVTGPSGGNNIIFAPERQCDGTSNTRIVAVAIQLETGSANYCVDNK